MPDGVLHLADMGLRNRIAIRTQPACQLPLRNGFPHLLLIQGFSFVDPNSPLDEHELALQIVFRQVTGQCDDFAAGLIPGAEQAVEAEVLLVAGLAVELIKDGQSRVATVANAVLFFSGATGDWGRGVQPALPDRLFDFRILRVAGGPGVRVVGKDIVQGQHHRGVGDRIAETLGCG